MVPKMGQDCIKHPRWQVPSSHGICRPSPAALLGNINVKLGLKSLAPFQRIQMTDQASFSYTKSFQPCLLWDTCQWDQLLHYGSHSQCCFPLAQWAVSMTQQWNYFIEITNYKLFTKMKANVKRNVCLTTVFSNVAGRLCRLSSCSN